MGKVTYLVVAVVVVVVVVVVDDDDDDDMLLYCSFPPHQAWRQRWVLSAQKLEQNARERYVINAM